jgi:hypothetical protein
VLTLLAPDLAEDKQLVEAVEAALSRV